MNDAHKFDMITRTVGEQLPNCIFYDYEECIGYRVEFYGDLNTLSNMPSLLDIAVSNSILVGSARHVETRRHNGVYVAEYHAYAVHKFEDAIPV